MRRLADAAEAGVATMASVGSAEFANDGAAFRPDWLLSAVPGRPAPAPVQGVVDYRPGTARAGTMTLHGRE